MLQFYTKSLLKLLIIKHMLRLAQRKGEMYLIQNMHLSIVL